MMRRLLLLLVLLPWLVPAVSRAQSVPIKRGVITVDSAPSGDCSAVPGQVRRVRSTGETYVCEGGSWYRRDLPPCNPDPPSGSCSGNAVCLSEAEASLYLCAGGSWQQVTGGGGGSGDMNKSTYDTDDDGVVDSAESALALSNAQDCLVTPDSDRLGQGFFLIDSDSDGTAEWRFAYLEDFCSPGQVLSVNQNHYVDCRTVAADGDLDSDVDGCPEVHANPAAGMVSFDVDGDCVFDSAITANGGITNLGDPAPVPLFSLGTPQFFLDDMAAGATSDMTLGYSGSSFQSFPVIGAAHISGFACAVSAAVTAGDVTLSLSHGFDDDYVSSGLAVVFDTTSQAGHWYVSSGGTDLDISSGENIKVTADDTDSDLAPSGALDFVCVVYLVAVR